MRPAPPPEMLDPSYREWLDLPPTPGDNPLDNRYDYSLPPMEEKPAKRDKTNPAKMVKVDKTYRVDFFPDTGSFHEGVMTFIQRYDGTVDNGQYSNHGTVRRDADPVMTYNPEPHGKVEGNTLYVVLDGVRRNAAHVAWWSYYGERLPKGTRVKHLDGDIWNNRKGNLSLVPPGKHHAITRIAGRVVSLGRFETRTEADDAVAAARAAVGMGPVKTRNRNPERKS